VVNKRAFWQLICIIALLVAQQAALTHSIWHYRDALPAHKQLVHAGATPYSDDNGGSPQSTLCQQHGILGALLSGTCHAQPPGISAGGSHRLVPATATWHVAQRTPSPHSRAPPVLL
jgi:hypothetical protein